MVIIMTKIIPKEIDLDQLLTGVVSTNIKKSKRRSKRKSRKSRKRRSFGKRRSKRKQSVKRKRRSKRKRSIKHRRKFGNTEQDEITTDTDKLLKQAQDFDKLAKELKTKERMDDLKADFEAIKKRSTKYLKKVAKGLGFFAILSVYFTGLLTINSTKEIVALIKKVNKQFKKKEEKTASTVTTVSTWVYESYKPTVWTQNAKNFSRIECILYKNLCNEEMEVVVMSDVTPVITGPKDTITGMEASV
jgi:hypothetical protein